MNSSHVTTVVAALILAALSHLHRADPALAQNRQYPGEQSRAKDVFFQPVAASAAEDQLLALNYKILLKRGDGIVLVPSDYPFKDGDRFRLAVQANTSGFLYLLHKGSTGAGRFLFPDARINGGWNRVAAYYEHTVPPAGWYEFDSHPGTETVHVILASEPLSQLMPLISDDPIRPFRWRQVIEVFVTAYNELRSERGTKDIVYVDPGQDISVAPTGRLPDAGNQTPPGGHPGETAAPTVESAQADPTDPDGADDTPQADQPTGGTASGARPGGDSRPASGASPQPNDQAIQVFVAQAAAPAGDGKLLVHSVCLKHE